MTHNQHLMTSARPRLRIDHLVLVIGLLLLLASCTGEFDQRQEVAEQTVPGGKSVGTVANPNSGVFVRGACSIGGAVRNALVTLRPISLDGSVDWDDHNALGRGVTFDNGIYQVHVQRPYRGPVLIEVRGQNAVSVVSDGGNPATSVSAKFHAMGPHHVLYSVLPFHEGASSDGTHVTPFTTLAVARSLSFNGGIAGVQGGIATGLFGLTCRQAARFFGLSNVRSSLPSDLAASGGFGLDALQAYALAALSQLARNLGVNNVWDFWLGLWLDGLDDGRANGSIGFVPGTGIGMPDLGQAGLLGDALFNDYLAPGNPDRPFNPDNTMIAGTPLGALAADLGAARDIDAATVDYDIVLRVPGEFELLRGTELRTSVLACQRIGAGTDFHPLGDSGGPSFVEFNWTSAAPGVLAILDYGRIRAATFAPVGDYEILLTVQPRAGQTFVTGPVQQYLFIVRVR